jgi:hypothetical protein
MFTRTFRATAFAAIVGLSVGASALPAHAQGDPGEICSTPTSDENQGNVAGTNNQICMAGGGGLVFVAPAVGQVATVVGPTIIGPSQVGTVVVSPGNVIAG